MSENDFDKRLTQNRENLRRLWQQYPLFVAGVLIVVILFIGMDYFTQSQNFASDLHRQFWLFVFVQALSITILALVLSKIWKKQRYNDDIHQLIYDAGNRNPSIAVPAVTELYERNLLGSDLFSQIGVLEGKDLTGANWDKVQLRNANLRGVILNDARLVNADLARSDLSGARLQGSNLWGAYLGYSMRGATLENANLAKATLIRTEMGGSQLNGSNFSEAELVDVTLMGAWASRTNFKMQKFMIAS